LKNDRAGFVLQKGHISMIVNPWGNSYHFNPVDVSLYPCLLIMLHSYAFAFMDIAGENVISLWGYMAL